MKLARPNAEVFVPDKAAVSRALARTTHLCIAAHPDDIEIMAVRAILDCFGRKDRWFTGVVVTDGTGSPRAGAYAKLTPRKLREVRMREQRKAAVLGDFGALVLLGHPSSAVKSRGKNDVCRDLAAVLKAARPDVVIGHNLADKHDTHVALALRTIEAIRSLPLRSRPKQFFGGEVWRDLDWMPDHGKTVWDVSAREDLQRALIAVFDSQIGGGKRYDLAVMGRRRAHATYGQSHKVDSATAVALGMDLTPLIRNDRLDPCSYMMRFVDAFRADVAARIARLG